MDILSNKAVLIGFGLLISIMIMTGVLVTVNQIKQIYGYVDKTDISVVKEFQDISSTYNGADMNGVDLVNTLKRFEGNNLILVEYPESVDSKAIAKRDNIRECDYINNLMKIESKYKYQDVYRVSVEYMDNNTKMKVVFK